MQLPYCDHGGPEAGFEISSGDSRTIIDPWEMIRTILAIKHHAHIPHNVTRVDLHVDHSRIDD